MNLVTTGNATISIATCIVGLLLFLPRTNLKAAVRFTLMSFRTADSRDGEGVTEGEAVELVPRAEPERELVDA